jgi:hypothetical protein
VLSRWFTDVIALATREESCQQTRERLAGRAHVTCLPYSLDTLTNVLHSLTSPACFWLTTPLWPVIAKRVLQGGFAHVVLVRLQHPPDREALASCMPSTISGRLCFVLGQTLVFVPLTPAIAAWFNTLAGSHAGRDIIVC